jgi:hypothetical protein
MPFISMNMNDVKEATASPKGSYELQITGAVPKESGPNSKHPGTPLIQFTLGFTDPEIDSPVFSHYMVFPYEGQTEYLNLTWLGIKRFLIHFGIPFNEEGVDIDSTCMEAIGQIAVCNVELTEPNDNGDVYNKLGYLPKLREELAASGKKSRSRK